MFCASIFCFFISLIAFSSGSFLADQNMHFYSPSQFNMGYVGQENMNGEVSFIAAGWTYFDFIDRYQRIDYTLPTGTLLSWNFSWQERVMLANYFGFTFSGGEFTCNTGIYPAPFPQLNSTHFDPPMVGVSIIEPFGPCYAWLISMGKYNMVYYTQVSSGWKPAMLVSNIYSVKYSDPTEGGINSNTFTPPSQCNFNMTDESNNDKQYDIHKQIALDSWIAAFIIHQKQFRV